MNEIFLLSNDLANQICYVLVPADVVPREIENSDFIVVVDDTV